MSCELALHGGQPRVVDDSPRQTRHSKATIVWPRSLELLERTNITEKLLAHGHQLSQIAFHQEGALVKLIELSHLKSTRYPFAVTLPQPTTESLMEQRLNELGVQVEWGTRLTGLSQHDDGVEACTRSAGAGRDSVQDCAWIVGADGASSTVRSLIGCSFPGHDVPATFMLTDAMVSHGLRKDQAQYFFSEHGSAATVPIGGDTFRIAASIDDIALDAITPAFLEALLLSRARLSTSIESVTYKGFFRAQVRQADAYKVGRVMLAGDAAHLTTPASGQGMNIGIQDAVNLGWRLGCVERGILGPAELELYATERRVTAAVVQAKTSAQTQVIDLQGRDPGGSDGPADPRRDPAEQAAGPTVPLMNAEEISQLDTLYPCSDGQDALVGTRLPVGFAADTAAASCCLGTIGPTLLLWPGTEWRSPDWKATVALVRDAAAHHVLVRDLAGMAPGKLTGILGVDPLAIVARPDGHVSDVCAPAHVVERLERHSNWLAAPVGTFVSSSDF